MTAQVVFAVTRQELQAMPGIKTRGYSYVFIRLSDEDIDEYYGVNQYSLESRVLPDNDSPTPDQPFFY